MTRSSPRHRLAVIAVLAFVCLVWGSTWLGIKISIRDQPPMGSAGARFLLAAALIAASAGRRQLSSGPRPGTVWWLGLAMAMIAIPYACVYVAEQYVPSGLAAVLFAVYPLFVALFAHGRIAGERLRVRLLAGIGCGVGGVVVLFGDLSAFHPRFTAGALLILASAAFSALATVLIRKRLAHMDPLLVNLRPMLYGGVILLLASLALERPLAWRLTLPGVAALLYLAAFGSVLAFGSYVWLMRSVPVSSLSFIVYVTPVVALGLGSWLENEPLGPRVALGSALILLAVLLARPSPTAGDEPA